MLQGNMDTDRVFWTSCPYYPYNAWPYYPAAPFTQLRSLQN